MEDEGANLASVLNYHELRTSATSVSRPPGSNVDILQDQNTGETIALCTLNPMGSFTFQGQPHPWAWLAYGLHLSVVLAAQHLNSGDTSLVPELEGLPNKCPIRFVVEALDEEGSTGVALKRVIDFAGRAPTGPKPPPCAIIGSASSTRSIPTATVSGVLGYPQISPYSTSAALDDKVIFPLFGRSVPSDVGNAIPLIIYFDQVLKAKHLAVININDAYGNAFVDGMRFAAEKFAPDLDIQQIPVSKEDISVQAAIQTLKRTQYRFVFTLVNGEEFHDTIMLEAFHNNLAGNGKHNWFYGDTFAGLEGRTFEKGSPLQLAYQ